MAQAAYENFWYVDQANKAYKKCLLQVITKAQKKQNITAYKFMPMSLATFSNVSLKFIVTRIFLIILFSQIVQTSYSSFTILRKLYE